MALRAGAGPLPAPPAYEAALLEGLAAGYEATWRFLLAERGALLAAGSPLAAFAGLPATYAPRELRIYALLAWQSLAPEALADEAARGRGLDRLNRALRHEPGLLPLVRAEREALERLDAPRFALNTSARDCAGVAGFFARDGYAAMRARLAALDPERLPAEAARLRRPARAPAES